MAANTDILATIVTQRLVDIKEAKSQVPLDKLKEQVEKGRFQACHQYITILQSIAQVFVFSSDFNIGTYRLLIYLED